jgi:sugar-specific transcriptional regulator TrmB
MRWDELELLEEIGLTGYERRALAALLAQGVADAETLCREGDIPSSKIYLAMEKLGSRAWPNSNPLVQNCIPQSPVMKW